MQSLDQANTAYWNELCGSGLAAVLGIIDASPESLKKFDDWYFDFYPYIFEHVNLQELAGKDVLEVGLGYGSLAQKLAQSGARYTGLDISPGPVEMLSHRIKQAGLTAEARQGNILSPDFVDESFDHIVAIGCLHHTGDMETAIKQCWRLLRSGGILTMMVYYAYSYRRWVQAPKQTLAYLISEALGQRGVLDSTPSGNTSDYDRNSAGDLAPHTDFISVKSLRHLCRSFKYFTYKKRNISQETPFSKKTREELLKTIWPSVCGLEIYACAVK